MDKRIVFFTLSILCFIFIFAKSYSNQPLAIVVKVTGPAWVTRDQDYPLTKGMELKANDRIKTGQQASAVIKFCDHHTVKLQPNTELKITGVEMASKKESISIYLQIGEILVDVWRRAQTSLGFEVESQAGIAGVRGTQFTVTVDIDGKMEVLVQKGLVELRSKFDGSKVELSKNHTASVTPGNSTSKPEKGGNRKSDRTQGKNSGKGSNNGSGNGNSGNGNGGHGGSSNGGKK